MKRLLGLFLSVVLAYAPAIAFADTPWSTFIDGAADAGSVSGGTKFGITLGAAQARYATPDEINTYLASVVGGDCVAGTLAGAFTLTCTKTGGVALTSAATTALGTSGGTLGLLNGNLTFSGNDVFSGGLTFSGLSAGTQVSCIGLDAGNHLVLNAAACGTGGGGGGSPGGANGNVQFNSSGSFGGVAGFTFDGTSALTLGQAGTSAGALKLQNATSGTITLAPPTGALGTVTVTVPAATDTLVNLSGTQTLTNKSIAASEVNSGTLGAARMPAFTGDVTTSAGAVATTIANNAVTYGKFQQVAASSLVGNSTGSTANAQDVGLANGLVMSGTNLALTAPDNTSSANYTISATDMAGQRNMSGTNLTLNIPAISPTVLAQGMTVLFTDYDPTALTISTNPTINGLASTTTLHQYGWANCVSNSSSLDCVGFPGFGTITTNALGRFVDASGAMTASALSDNGTILSASESISAQTNSFVTEVANEAATGTTVNKLAKMTGNPQKAIIASTSNTDGVIGIVIGGAGKTGSAQIAVGGQATCVFDGGGVTAGNYVIISSTVAGACKDSGVAAASGSVPTATQTIGIAQSTVAASGSGLVNIGKFYTNTAGGGSGTVNAGTAGQLAYYAASAAAVSGNANLTISGAALSIGASGTAGTAILGGGTSGTTTLAASATASGTATLPANTGTIAELNLAQSWTATQTITAANPLILGANSGNIGKIKFFGNTSGDVTLTPNAAAGTGITLTMPATTGTLVTTGDSGTVTGGMIASGVALAGNPTTTTQSAKDNSTKIATTAYVDRPTGLTTGTSVTLTAPRQYFICTSTCTITVPAPAAGYEFCVINDVAVSTVITLSAIGSSAQYGKTDQSAYGTAGTGTAVSGGAVGDKICLLGKDSTHYNVASFGGTWTMN